MRPHRSLSLAVLCTLLVALGVPAGAQAASVFEQVSTNLINKGAIEPCKFTSAELTKAKNSVPPNLEQYAPDFKDAVDAALKQRAQGVCDKKAAGTKKNTDTGAAVAPTTGGGTTGAAPAGNTPAQGTAAPTTSTAAPTTQAAVTPTPQPAPSVTPAPVVADGAILAAARNTSSDSDLPAPFVALALLAALAALAALAVFSTRWLAFEPRWVVRSRHATAEAGWRTSAAWAEFRDWLRLGR
ncbi:hypothetical protein DSM112329_04832 [Paraconexibacter sp. AEG42_29]|uniref:Uncharacterized protein n=1 Tax=Paraconexibacter sp. AEG42_29 TaxID=2997339 RepID=A0AAU7B226_9ACTN